LGGGADPELVDPLEDDVPLEDEPPFEDEAPDPFVAAALAAEGLEAAGLAALVLVGVNARAAKAPVPLLQPQPQNTEAIRKKRVRNESDFWGLR
jgi:hypothetical protein